MSRAKITSPKEIRALVAGLRLEARIDRNVCRTCGETIRMQIRRGTGYCSARCEEREVPF